MTPIRTLSRREMLRRVGTGLGTIGLASVLADDASAAPFDPLALRQPHHAPKAKHVIHLFMEGGPSQVDTFDPKPELAKHHGTRPPAANFETERPTFNLMKSDFKFNRCGQSGIEVSDIFPEVGKCIDDICVIRSMYTDVPNHEPGLLMMNCGHNQPIRPSMGRGFAMAWGISTATFRVMSFYLGPRLWGRRIGRTASCREFIRGASSAISIHGERCRIARTPLFLVRRSVSSSICFRE